MKRQPTEWEEILQTMYQIKKIYKELIQPDNKKPNNPILKNGQRNIFRYFSKVDIKWPTGT